MPVRRIPTAVAVALAAACGVSAQTPGRAAHVSIPREGVYLFDGKPAEREDMPQYVVDDLDGLPGGDYRRVRSQALTTIHPVVGPSRCTLRPIGI